MPLIDPLSVVDPDVRLASDVEVGPWCIIQGAVTIGAGTRLLAHVCLRGPIVIGEGNVIHPYTCIGVDAQHRGHTRGPTDGGVSIGDGNVIRESVTISASTGATPTSLGNRNYLMVGSHLGHDTAVGDDCTLVNYTLLAGHVEIQNGVTLGGHSGVHQHCRIGRLSMISGGMILTQDLPPFCTCYTSRTVGSLNLVGLRRAGYRAHIAPLQEAFDLFFRRRHTVKRALELIAESCGGDPLVAELVQFVRGTRRGITRFSQELGESEPTTGSGTADAPQLVLHR